jgi:hypothetical protein
MILRTGAGRVLRDTYEWDVQLTRANRQRYRWLCEQERRNNITHLNVTPGGEISHVVCE